MSESQDKLHLNGSQKPQTGGPEAFAQTGKDIEAAQGQDDDYYYDADGDDDEDAEDEVEAGQYPLDPYATLAQQLASSPLFAQVQALLGGGGSLEAKMSMAQLQQASGNLEEAAEAYLDIVEENPDYAKAYVALGQTLLAMDQPDKAETYLGKATELEPENAAAYLYLGYAHYARQDFEKCIEDFKQAVVLDPDSHISLNNLGYTQYLTGRLGEAEKTFVKAGDVGSNRAYYNLGLVRLLEGQEDKAWEAYQDAIDLDPQGSQIEDHLADLEQAKTRYPAQVALLNQAIERLNEQYEDYEEDDDQDDDAEDPQDEYAPKD